VGAVFIVVTDLVDGAKVQCTYTYAPSNMMNLAKGGFGFGGLGAAVAVSDSGIKVSHVLRLQHSAAAWWTVGTVLL
jgi:hypothetical protein